VSIIPIIPDGNALHLPQVTLAMYQKGVNYSGIKIFNGLPKALKDTSSKPNKFKIVLKHSLHTHSFYPLGEFFLTNNSILFSVVQINFFVPISYPLYLYLSLVFQPLFLSL
jgi:hypothetical protein